jgi:hypothetical protein
MSAAGAILYGWSSSRYYLRPIIIGMLTLALLSGAYMLSILHQSNRAEYPNFLIRLISERTRPDDDILTNLAYTGDRFAVQFYTYRNVQWDVAVTTALVEDKGSVYLYCDAGDIPLELADLSYKLVGDCLLVRLDRS